MKLNMRRIAAAILVAIDLALVLCIFLVGSQLG